MRLLVWALKGEVEKVVVSPFPHGVEGAWDNSLTCSALFVKHLLVSAAIAKLSLEEMERLYEWAVDRLGNRLHETAQTKAAFHAIVFAVNEGGMWSTDSDQDPAHAVIRRGPPERSLGFFVGCGPLTLRSP
uniref:Uncharacterized protein n=1 Tax=Chromera velia CCMP2878 TaxID=1169474 RepID=A0A0K6S9V4_9ALVE|eukprot:Cvel_8569.t1-p1 / transcript=Cvel_8569.t1 / gene=Cvel_8569 / organism=Chromera_velia_CCMP2878 / gene_product=hypothetical protein / transcript_product=hypothetical protein / location=Cvel_scaffold475:62476-62865(+) / protein_length=130 / sequence_SO=supercontig / SO=protein_coding / is_pseudo=false